MCAGATGEIAKESEYEEEDDTCDCAEASVHAYAGSSHTSRLNTGSQVSGLNTGSSCEDAIGKELEKLADRAGVIAGGPSLPEPAAAVRLPLQGSAKVTQLATAGVPFLSAIRGVGISAYTSVVGDPARQNTVRQSARECDFTQTCLCLVNRPCQSPSP